MGFCADGSVAHSFPPAPSHTRTVRISKRLPRSTGCPASDLASTSPHRDRNVGLAIAQARKNHGHDPRVVCHGCDTIGRCGDLAMRVDGTCSARGLARISRFAWMMGARAKWSTDGMSFKDLCSALDTHILEHILPKCEPRYVFLPDVTGDGWRPDLGIQSPTKPQMARFTTWMTMVAAGALSGMALLDGRDQPSDGSSKLEYHPAQRRSMRGCNAWSVTATSGQGRV